MKSKKEKVNEARKNAEALKAKKKAERGSKTVETSVVAGKGKAKPKSNIGQAKKK